MNLKQLAAVLGLSQTTVSRALNGYPEVNETTRQRVLDAASRAGYRPSPAARRLATGQAHALGIVFPVERNVLLDPHFVEFLGGISETAASHGLDILISPTGVEEEIATYERLAHNGTVDAVIVSSPAEDDPRLERLSTLDFPVVVHGRPRADLGLSHLDIDNEGSFYAGAMALIRLGHRRIGLLNGDERLTFAVHRRSGLTRALAEAGLEIDEAVFRNGPMTVDNGYIFARAMLAEALRPTAFVCASILLAFGALRAIAEAGLRVPEDVSVLCHDDEMPAFRAETMHPPLTTLGSSIRAAGARIAELAIERIGAAGEPPVSEIWPVDLVIRRSSGPVSA